MEKKADKKLWFKAKTYGWGWTPASWEGWVVIGAYVVLFVWLMKNVEDASSIDLYFFLKVLVLVATLIAISYTKGEKPRWRWAVHKLLGRGYYYDVYDLGNGFVYKKRRNIILTIIWAVFHFKEPFKKLPQYIHYFLTIDKETKSLYKRIPKEVYPILGNPIFDNDGVQYKQEKTRILQDILDEISEESFIEWVDGYIKTIHSTWSYGFSDVVFNITVNTGKNKAGNIIQVDFNEITFDKNKIIEELNKKYWTHNFSYKQLPAKYKEILLMKMEASVNKDKLNQVWGKWGKE